MTKGIRAWRFIVAALIIIHLGMSTLYIWRWFFSGILRSYLVYYNLPVEERLFTMSPTETSFILSVRKTLPEDGHILWLAQVDPIVNYYIYPRQMFHPGDKKAVDREFIESRKIKYVFYGFDKLVPVDSVINEGNPELGSKE